MSRWTVPVWILLWQLTAVGSQASEAAEIEWASSARRAQVAATSSGRPLLVYVKSASCLACARLEQNTWTDDRVAARVSTGFVPLQVVAEQSPRVAQQVGAKVYPTIVVISPTGSLLNRVNGFMDGEAMLQFLSRSQVAATDRGNL